MLDPSTPWLAPGYRKFLSKDFCSSHSTVSQSASINDFHVTHSSTPVNNQQRRVRSAVALGRFHSQPTPPSSPHGSPGKALHRPRSASPRNWNHREGYGLEQPVFHRPKSATGRYYHRGVNESEQAMSVLTQYRLPRRVKSARLIRHRPCTSQNKSITQVERLHHARLTSSAVPVGQTTDHKLCAYCPVECRPHSSNSHRPTSSTGLSAADVPSHYDRTKFWANGSARPRTAPTFRREFLHLPRHNYIRRGTVPHYTHFVRGLSLYPRDGSPLPVPPTIVVQDGEDEDRSEVGSQFGETDTIALSASVLNDSDWEDAEDDISDYGEDIGVSDAMESKDDQCEPNEDIPSASLEATEMLEPLLLQDTLRDNSNKELPTTPATSPVMEHDKTTTNPTKDADSTNSHDHDQEITDLGATYDPAQESQPEITSHDESNEADGGSYGGAEKDISQETEALQGRMEETLVLEDGDKEDIKENGVTELKPVVKMIPTRPPVDQAKARQELPKETMQDDKKARWREESTVRKVVRIQEPAGSTAVKPGENGSNMRRESEGEAVNTRDPESTIPVNVSEELVTTEDLSKDEQVVMPDIVLSSEATAPDETDTIISSQETPMSGDKPVGVKLGPPPAKVKVDFMSMDSETMREILDMEMKLRRREAAEKSVNSEDLLETSHSQNKKAFVPSSWNCCRVALSCRAGRFEVPMDMRDMIGLTPVEYLLKYCKVNSQRRAMYKRTFSKVDRDKDGKLTRKELDRAVTEALVDTVTEEQVTEVLQSIGAGDKNLMMPFDLFAPFCALLERLYYSQYVTEDSADREACEKDRIEDADFTALDWKLDGYDINDDLRRLLHSL